MNNSQTEKKVQSTITCAEIRRVSFLPIPSEPRLLDDDGFRALSSARKTIPKCQSKTYLRVCKLCETHIPYKEAFSISDEYFCSLDCLQVWKMSTHLSPKEVKNRYCARMDVDGIH